MPGWIELVSLVFNNQGEAQRLVLASSVTLKRYIAHNDVTQCGNQMYMYVMTSKQLLLAT